ncbi:RNA/RNP complex-1-interacting phosphatase [Brevipalpus obovatus]|uniref:RNA/RNP complex-1-interacting phosphatase n=1 Tax=Brevipalpus obovatus TaxID=246614 RepID=UPI003D9E1788
MDTILFCQNCQNCIVNQVDQSGPFLVVILGIPYSREEKIALINSTSLSGTIRIELIFPELNGNFVGQENKTSTEMYSKKWLEWLATPSCGEKIDGTPFISFKAPLQNDARFEPSQRFNFGILFHKHPNIGLIIDLTPSSRYYDPQILKSFNVEHRKIPVAGFGTIPSSDEIRQFIRAVDEFRSQYPHRDIGVHCFHGLNRTGLMICLYLMKRFSYRPEAAIEAFNSARGKGIEREIYINYLMTKERPRRKRIDYRNSKARSNREVPSLASRSSLDTNWRIPSHSYRRNA